MDLLTQGLLGAALSQTAARRAESRLATFVGLAAGVAADADVLIRSGTDPLLTLEYHRHFTHSVFFIPLGALLVALLLWPLLRSRLAFGRLYLFSLLGFSLSGFLDACTSYGTHLFWPLLTDRISWQIISIIDPVFTLALLVAVILGYRRRVRTAAWMGLGLAGSYLLLGLVQQQRAETIAIELAEKRGHEQERLLVKPTLGNLFLWRSVYLSGDRFHVDAVRVGFGEQKRVYPGGSLQRLDSMRDIPNLVSDSMLYRDIQRFSRFSDGYVALHPQRSDIVGDVRYANLPTGLEPLWGIEIDPSRPGEHARYGFHRDLSGENRERFIHMLLGGDTPLTHGF